MAGVVRLARQSFEQPCRAAAAWVSECWLCAADSRAGRLCARVGTREGNGIGVRVGVAAPTILFLPSSLSGPRHAWVKNRPHRCGLLVACRSLVDYHNSALAGRALSRRPWLASSRSVSSPRFLIWISFPPALNKLGPRRLDNGRRRVGSISTEFDIRANFLRNAVLDAAFDRLKVGSEVAFAEEEGVKGPQASTVRVVGGHRRTRV